MGYLIQYYFIALSMLVGFVMLVLGQSKARYLRLFPFFLLITLANELYSDWLADRYLNNIIFYNFFSVTAFAFYFYIIWVSVYSKKAKKVILYLMIAYTVGSLYNIFFGQTINTFHTYTYSLGCLLLVAVCIYYFLELFQYPRFIDLKKEPAFWIVSGLLFFYTCTLPILGVINYLYTFPDFINVAMQQLIMVLNVLLYSLFTIAFLCRIIFKRSTS